MMVLCDQRLNVSQISAFQKKPLLNFINNVLYLIFRSTEDQIVSPSDLNTSLIQFDNLISSVVLCF
eukprot:scaffold107298_cov58-Attheya_sp.AAC.2